MAIILNGTTHQLRSDSFGASRPSAYSIATWWRADSALSTVASEVIMAVGTTGTDAGDLFLTWGHGVALFRNVAGIHTNGGVYFSTNTAGSTSATTWYHRAATYAAGALKFFENGAQIGATATPTVTAGAPADWVVAVGGGDAGSSNRVAGRVCMIGYWDVQLSDAEVAALGKGAAPHLVRPQSLRYYVPGLRDANAVKGATNTASNLTYSGDNPRIYL